MSRIGKLPIHVPAGVTVTIKDNVVTVKGPKGELVQEMCIRDRHNRARKPGSIGACSYPAKVFKGMRMGGQMEMCIRDSFQSVRSDDIALSSVRIIQQSDTR